MVLVILSMMAGIILPSAATYIRRNSVESLAHNISILCREAFQRAIFTGRPLIVKYNKSLRELAVYTPSKESPVKVVGVFLEPIKISQNYILSWPEKGWKVIPEGYCESSQIRITDKKTSNMIVLKFRPYDAMLEKE